MEVLGFDPETGGRDCRERIGIVLQKAGVDDDFSPRELIKLYPVWVFFAIGFPLAQYLFTAAMMGDLSTDPTFKHPFGLQSATGMIAWGAIVTAMVFVPDAIAHARDNGSLKRLRGTPCR